MDQKAIETLPFGQTRFKPDTAAGCREKATANLAQAVSLHTGHERTLLERSAAAWSMRAEQLQRQESKFAPGHAGPESDRCENEGGGIRPAPPPVILEELQQELG